MLTLSVAELEVIEGMLKSKDNAELDRNCLCFMRDITNIHSYLDSRRAHHFVDMTNDSIKIVEEKNVAINKLRNETIMTILGEDNIYSESVEWEDPVGICKQSHKAYLDKLCGYFFSRVRDMISVNINQQRQMQKDSLYEEVVQHWNLCKAKCDVFVGRDVILEEIKDYILGGTDKVFIIHGESGIGKTSIMAKAASMINTWVGEEGMDVQTTVILRFCGTSPATSSIRQLIGGLCHQITYAVGKYRSQIPEDYKDLKKYFIELISNGESGGMIIIFLDALDQLSSDDDAFKMDWIPAKISNNVKIVISTLPKEGGILARLESKITDSRYHLEIGTLSPNNCSDIIHFWLTHAKRILSFAQWKGVKEAFYHCSTPLFTKLTFEEIVRWKSYTPINKDTLPLCVNACIHKLFDRIEEKHGQVLVAHSLAYITASRNGISEAELEDMISLDDKALNAIFLFWEPPIRRVPINLWLRVRHELASYLVERETDDTGVIFWYHRQFIEAAHARYLSDEEQSQYIHGVMADYYLGTWSKMKKKPFKYEQVLMERMHITDPNGAAVRYVPEQPLIYSTFNTEERFNLRALRQVPYHLAQAGQYERLNREVFFNYNWIYTKLRATSIQQVLADYNITDDREVTLVADALRMAESALAMYPNVLGPEISGRLLPHASTYANIKSLIYDCDQAALMKCPFVPCWQTYTCPGGPLQYVCGAECSANSTIDVDTIQQSDDILLLTAKPFNSTKMQIWDVSQGEPKHSLELPAGSNVYPTLNGTFINLIKDNKYLQTFRLDSGELYGEVAFGHGNIGCIAVGNKYVAIAFREAPGPCILDIEARIMLHKMSFQSTTVVISDDDRYILCNSGQIITLHELPLLERKCVIQCKDIPTKIVFTKSNYKFYVMFRSKEVQCMDINPTNRKAKTTSLLQDIEMKDFVLSYMQNMLLVRAARCIYVYDTNKNKMMHRIVRMPPGVFLEQLSIYKEARFTKDDKFIVAARHTYMGVWFSETGEPVRLLQSVVSPIEKIFTSNIVNKAITLLEDNSIQVWNLDNVESDVQHCNELVKGRVKSIHATRDVSKVICSGTTNAEAKVFNTVTGHTQWNLVHSDKHGAHIRNVLISPLGKYAITRTHNSDIPQAEKSWQELYEEKLWDMTTGDLVLTITRGQHIALDPEDRRIVFFKCINYSFYDWLMTKYIAIIFDCESQTTYKEIIPAGHMVGKPVITYGGRYLAFIIQTCHRKFDSSINEQSRSYNIVLCLYSFNNQWRNIKTMSLQHIWSGFGNDDSFLDVKNINDDCLLICYGKDMPYYVINTEGVLNRSSSIVKGAMVYNIKQDHLIKRYDNFLAPSSNIDTLVVSGTTAIILDDRHDLFDVVTETPPAKLVHLETLAAKGTVQFLLDGRYLVMIAKNHREILLVRKERKDVIGKCFIHGIGTVLVVGEDDRTVLVGCTDGRVMMFTVVIESCDPMFEIISHLPSRSPIKHVSINVPGQSNDTLDKDVKHIVNSNHELRQLSAKTRHNHEEVQRKVPSFRTIGQAVLAAQMYNKSQSRACSIQ